MDKEYLIKKWLTGELTDAEFEVFKELDEYGTHLKILEGASYFKASEVAEVADLDAFYTKLNSNKRKQHSTSFFKPFLKIAAILVVLVGLGSLFLLNNNNVSIETSVSEKTSVELPDASKVVLNSKSEITFNKRDWKKKREVSLEGEAFFKVLKGSSFDVVTNAGTVSVLGTQFNVKSRKGYFEVHCFEGLVHVQYNGFVKNLPAGGTFKVVNGIVTSDTDATSEKAPQWISNVSSFKSVPFYEVIKEFERQYDVAFSLENIDASRIFTGGFVHTSLEDGLKSITLPLDLKYSIDSSNSITLYKDKP